MMNTKLKQFMAISGLLVTASGTALAEDFYLDLNDADAYLTATQGAGQEFSSGDNGITVDAAQLSIDGEATSNYADFDGSGGVSVGDRVIDEGFGNSLQLLALNGTEITGSNNNEGIGSTFGFSYSYDDLSGLVFAVDDQTGSGGAFGVGAAYNMGTIEVNIDQLDSGDGSILYTEKIFSLNVFGSGGTIGDVVLLAEVDFTGATVDLVEDMWFFADGSNWYDLWAAGDAATIEIAARIDTNVDPQVTPTANGTISITNPPYPESEATGGVNDDGVYNQYSRTNTLNGSVQFDRQVPEPGMLALMGIGLLGFFAARVGRRKKA